MRYTRLILMVVAMACLLQVASAAPEIFIEPSSSMVANGNTFTVNVEVDPMDSEVTTALYTLQFDNTHLRVISQTPGTFLSHDGEETKVDKNEINNTAGTVTYGEYIKATPDDDTFGMSRQGTLASITFEAISDDVIGGLNFTNSKLAVVTGRPDDILVVTLFASDINLYNGSYMVTEKPGDLNADGIITSADAVIALQMAVRGDYDALADLNGDYRVTSLDALMILQQLAVDPVISVSEQPTGIVIGDTFTAEVTVDPAGAEIYAAQYDLYFNSTILRASGQMQGTFLSQGDAGTHVGLNTINNTVGKIQYAETRTGVPETVGGATKPGILASINFEVIGEGVSTLTLSDVLYDVLYVTPDDLIDPEP